MNLILLYSKGLEFLLRVTKGQNQRKVMQSVGQWPARVILSAILFYSLLALRTRQQFMRFAVYDSPSENQ